MSSSISIFAIGLSKIALLLLIFNAHFQASQLLHALSFNWYLSVGGGTEGNSAAVIWPERYNHNAALQSNCSIGLLHKITLLLIATAMHY